MIAALKRAVDPPWLSRMVAALLNLERFRCNTAEEVAEWLRGRVEALRTRAVAEGREQLAAYTERQAAQRIVEIACEDESKAVSKRDSNAMAWGVFKGGFWLAAICGLVALIVSYWHLL